MSIPIGALNLRCTPEVRIPHVLINVATQSNIVFRMYTPNQAADLNHDMRRSNLRWLPASTHVNGWD